LLSADRQPSRRLPIHSARPSSYEKSKVKPLFPFGFGLSYTTFRFANLKVTQTATGGEAHITASFDVTNTGKRKGAEVAQFHQLGGRQLRRRLNHGCHARIIQYSGKVDLVECPSDFVTPQRSLTVISVAQAFLPVFRVSPAIAFLSRKKNTGTNACATGRLLRERYRQFTSGMFH